MYLIYNNNNKIPNKNEKEILILQYNTQNSGKKNFFFWLKKFSISSRLFVSHKRTHTHRDTHTHIRQPTNRLKTKWTKKNKDKLSSSEKQKCACARINKIGH